LKVFLDDIANARSGDKGNIADISLFAMNEEIYNFLISEVTSEKVKAYFEGICKGEVKRYEVPNVLALKFVLNEALGGGAPLSIRIDNIGKALGAALLRMEIEVPNNLMKDVEIQKPPSELSTFNDVYDF
jgi:hypothetical protein